jgi:hypothetical protein
VFLYAELNLTRDGHGGLSRSGTEGGQCSQGNNRKFCSQSAAKCSTLTQGFATVKTQGVACCAERYYNAGLQR